MYKRQSLPCHYHLSDQSYWIHSSPLDIFQSQLHSVLSVYLSLIHISIQLLKEEAREEKENTKEMVSDISHQLKTPVAALDTCFSVLMQNDLSATEQEAVSYTHL